MDKIRIYIALLFCQAISFILPVLAQDNTGSDSNWYDYGARWMDAAIGRWHVMDPFCEKYYDVSPYAYCHNNPIMLVDLDGMDDYYDYYGDFLFSDNKETDNIIIRKIYLEFMSI